MSDFCFTRCLADSLYIISHSISFVKRFFKTYFKFFEAFRLARSQRPFYYITLEGVCQVVFERFLRFFRSLALFRFPDALSRGDSQIIPYPARFVNTFSQSFCGFLQILAGYRSMAYSAGNRGRTCTVSHWILNPARLPIPPYPHGIILPQIPPIVKSDFY